MKPGALPALEARRRELMATGLTWHQATVELGRRGGAIAARHRAERAVAEAALRAPIRTAADLTDQDVRTILRQKPNPILIGIRPAVRRANVYRNE